MGPISGKTNQVVPYNSPSSASSSGEPGKLEFGGATVDMKIGYKPGIFERLVESLSTFARKFTSAAAKPAALSIAAAPAQPARPPSSPTRSASPSPRSGPGEAPTVDEILSIMQKENDRLESDPKSVSFKPSAESKARASHGQPTTAEKAAAQKQADNEENARMMRAMRGRSS